MKRVFLIFLILLCSCPVQSSMLQAVVGQAPAAATSCDCTSGCTFIGSNITTGSLDTGDAGHVFGYSPSQAMWQTGSGDAGKQVCEISVYAHYGSNATYTIRTAMYDNSATPALIADTQNTTVSNSGYAWIGAMNSTQINGGTPVYVAASTYYTGFVYFSNSDTWTKYSSTGTNSSKQTHPVNYSSGFPASITGLTTNSSGYNIRIGYK